MKKELHELKSKQIHLVIDIWTTKNNVSAVMGVKAQFVTLNWKLKQFVLGFIDFPEYHTAVNIRTRLEIFLQKFGLNLSEVCFVTVLFTSHEGSRNKFLLICALWLLIDRHRYLR